MILLKNEEQKTQVSPLITFCGRSHRKLHRWILEKKCVHRYELMFWNGWTKFGESFQMK